MRVIIRHRHLHAIQCQLEQAFLTTANHNNYPKIHAMTKRYPKDPILFSYVEINRVYSCHRITTIYFLCRAILSLKRRCLPAEVMHRRQHRHLMTIICFAVYFPWFLCQLIRVSTRRNPASICNICTSPLFAKLQIRFTSNLNRLKYLGWRTLYNTLYHAKCGGRNVQCRINT